MNANDSPNRDYRTITWRCLRLRCPACGKGKLFRDWFRTADQCEDCRYDLVREPGFYLGSIYVNYGLTALLLVAICSPLVLLTDIPYSVLTPLALFFCLLFPIWFHRYARALWLGFDYRWDGFRSAAANRPSGASSDAASSDAAASDAAKQPSAAESTSDDGLPATCPFCHHHARYDARAGDWTACRQCGQQMLLTTASQAPSE